jgi:hypothetical protein
MPCGTPEMGGRFQVVSSPGRALGCWAIVLSCFVAPSSGQWAPGHAGGDSQGQPNCTDLLQKQDAGAVAACKTQVEDAEKSPPTEHMARIVAHDEYGVALLAVAHQPRLAVESFDRAIALLPASTVKPNSLQWAVMFWHRATAYQQLLQWERAATDLATAEGTFTRAIAAATGDTTLAEHFTQLRQRVRTQHAEILERLGRRSEAQKLLATQ